MTGMPPHLMSLPAEAFVRAAVDHLNVPSITQRDISILTQTIFQGVNKLRVWETLEARAQSRAARSAPRAPTALVRPDDMLAVEEVLTGHAPEDDVVFLEYAFHRLIGRAPELYERLALQRDLAEGAADRSAVIASLVQLAFGEDKVPVVARLDGAGQFVLVSGKCSERLLLLHRMLDGELAAADGCLTAAARMVKDGLTLEPGLIFLGPKRSLRAGLWRLNVDWYQSADSVITIAATANAGVEPLFSMTLGGPAVFSSEFRVLPEHLVVEVAVYAERHTPAEEARAWTVNPRDLSLSWIGA